MYFKIYTSIISVLLIILFIVSLCTMELSSSMRFLTEINIILLGYGVIKKFWRADCIFGRKIKDRQARETAEMKRITAKASGRLTQQQEIVDIAVQDLDQTVARYNTRRDLKMPIDYAPPED